METNLFNSNFYVMLFCIRQQTEKKFQETSKGDAIYAMHNIESTYNPTHNNKPSEPHLHQSQMDHGKIEPKKYN